MRCPDWKGRLTAYLIAAASRPYSLGQHDCALFAAGAVDAQRGLDPARDWRGRYDTKLGGLRLLRAAGHEDHIAATAALLEEIRPVFAAGGDVAMVSEADAPSLGVVQGEMVYVLRPDGLGLVPRAMIVRAWRV